MIYQIMKNTPGNENNKLVLHNKQRRNKKS